MNVPMNGMIIAGTYGGIMIFSTLAYIIYVGMTTMI